MSTPCVTICSTSLVEMFGDNFEKQNALRYCLFVSRAALSYWFFSFPFLYEQVSRYPKILLVFGVAFLASLSSHLETFANGISTEVVFLFVGYGISLTKMAKAFWNCAWEKDGPDMKFLFICNILLCVDGLLPFVFLDMNHKFLSLFICGFFTEIFCFFEFSLISNEWKLYKKWFHLLQNGHSYSSIFHLYKNNVDVLEHEYQKSKEAMLSTCKEVHSSETSEEYFLTDVRFMPSELLDSFANIPFPILVPICCEQIICDYVGFWKINLMRIRPPVICPLVQEASEFIPRVAEVCVMVETHNREHVLFVLKSWKNLSPLLLTNKTYRDVMFICDPTASPEIKMLQLFFLCNSFK